MNHPTSETTKSTRQDDTLPQKKSLTRRAITQSIAVCVKWAKAMTFDTLCAGMVIHLLTTQLSRQNTSPNILLDLIGKN